MWTRGVGVSIVYYLFTIFFKISRLLIILIKRDRKGAPWYSVVSTTKKIFELSCAIVTRKNRRNRKNLVSYMKEVLLHNFNILLLRSIL